MIDLSAARELVVFWTPLVFLTLFVFVSGAVLLAYRGEKDSAHSSAFYFFKRMGLSLLVVAMLSLLAFAVEIGVWDSTASVHQILETEVQRVYGISFSRDSTFGLHTAGVGTDSAGNQVIVRYNRETNKLETVAAWETLTAK